MNAAPVRLHLVQLAGGKGLRAGGQVPKQFRRTARGLLLGVSLREFLKLPAETAEIVSITVTAAAERAEILTEVFAELRAAGLGAEGAEGSEGSEGSERIIRAEPGRSRTESTWHALCRIAEKQNPQPEDLVAVHDAARPLATVDLLARLVAAARRQGAAVPGIAVPDTIVQQDPGAATVRYLPRETLLAVQTPQVFRWDLLHAAHAWAAAAGVTFTDDGGLVAHRGDDPAIVPGEEGNFKVTTDADWQRANAFLSR
ncbi:hypothetical protein CSA17_03855 [bacterium DOLJORAL78_65_58]|nr:MAG: hypothetical protein CSB20_12170 [bacterium DOLZORAL124_64_63]PIE76129.1 MAG: hypothetical protein CSA17_03855 [bacterium DOLJORAL78_65_58]